MRKNKNADIYSDEINYIVESIINIEKQIEYFERSKLCFFSKNKRRECDERIERLGDVKKYLCSRLEYLIDNKQK